MQMIHIKVRVLIKLEFFKKNSPGKWIGSGRTIEIYYPIITLLADSLVVGLKGVFSFL